MARGSPSPQGVTFRCPRSPWETDLREGCLAARLGLVEVHEEGEHAWSLRRPDGGVLVVVPLVELPRLVAHDLQVLAVVVRNADDLVDPRCDVVHEGVREAAGEVAPALVGGAHWVELVARERAQRLFSHHPEGLGLLLAHKIIELQHHGDVERALASTAGSGEDILEDTGEAARRHRRPVVALAAVLARHQRVAPGQPAHSRRLCAFPAHVEFHRGDAAPSRLVPCRTGVSSM